MKKLIQLYLIPLIGILISCGQPNQLTISSPDGNLLLSINRNELGEIFYSVDAENQKLLSLSKLGLELADNQSLVSNFQIVDSEESNFYEEWQTVWGTDQMVINHYNQLFVKLRNENGVLLNMYFRVFDDGIGFRYEVPSQSGIDSILISDEITEFNFAQNGTAWSIPADYDSYEHLYRTTKLDEVKDANTPITLKTDSNWYVSIHEANLTDYAGMTFVNSGGTNFNCNLTPWPDGIKVKTKAPMVTPWRTLTITKDASELIESKMILNLNEPNVIEDVSWIKPMKYVGIWWGIHLGVETWTLGPNHGATTENMKRYIDFAAENNIDAVLAEGWNTGWENWGQPNAFDYTTPYSDYDLDEILRYSKEKGIELIGHHETGGDIISYEEKLDEVFSIFNKNGINAIKTGYAGSIPNGQHHHGQWMVKHYRKVVETAAKYQITLDVHEPIKATGISRTWPNMMTREGVRGMEWNAWSEGNPPEHHVIVPFTRGLGGPIDYTPGIFDILYKERKDYIRWNGNDKGNSRVNTTLAKQLALWITLYSPLQMASDMIKNYEDHPAFEFFSHLPSEWTESKVLEAEIGDYIMIARKSDEAWYIGAVTDEQSRLLELDLSFLTEGENYQAIIYADGDDANWKDNPTSYKIENLKVNSSTILEINMAPGGGQAIEIIPD
jgi:alpha-glucosidase